MYCPMPMKMTIGSTQVSRKLSSGDICSMISPENCAPESASRWVRSGYYYCTLIVNILGLILGFVMIVNPALSLFSVSYVIGIYLLLAGIDHLVLAVSNIGKRGYGITTRATSTATACAAPAKRTRTG